MMKIRLTLLFLVIAVSGVAQKKEIRKIEKAVNGGDFNKAIEIFNTINESEVEEKYLADYTFYKAASFLNVDGSTMPSVDHINKANAAFKKSLKLGFDNPQFIPLLQSMITQGQFKIAQNLVKENKTSEALKVVMDIYNDDPSNIEMLYNAASLAYQGKEFDTAITHYETLLEKDYTGIYNTYYGVDSKGEKTALAKTAIEVGISSGTFTKMETAASPSKLGEILTNLSWMYTQKGDLEKAKDVFTATMSKYPNDESIANSSSTIYLQLGMMDEYQASMEKLLNGKKDPVVFENLANSALANGNYDDAIQFYDKSLELQGDNVVALNNAANAFIQVANNMSFDESTVKGSYNEAIRAFNESKKSKYRKAMNYLERAIKVEPKNKSVAENLLGLYNYFEMDDKADALKATF